MWLLLASKESLHLKSTLHLPHIFPNSHASNDLLDGFFLPLFLVALEIVSELSQLT